jgi:Tfp pilus assembly protein PilO
MLDGLLSLQPHFTDHWFDMKLIPMWLVVLVTLILGYVNWFNHRFKHLAVDRQSEDTTGILQTLRSP